MVLAHVEGDAGGAVLPWTHGLQNGFTVEVLVYGERMVGRVREVGPDRIAIQVPVAEQVSGVQLNTAYGTAVLSREGGATTVPVSIRQRGDTLQLQAVGPAEFTQRRQHPRAALNVPVTLVWLATGGRTWHRVATHTVDISLGGVRIGPARTVWPGGDREILVSIELPEGQVELPAKAVGVTPDYGLRLQFTKVPDEVAARLARVTQCMPGGG